MGDPTDPTQPIPADDGVASGTIPDGGAFAPDNNAGAPNVVEAPPTVPAELLAPGPDAAIPAPPGRAAPGTPVGAMLAAGVPQPAGSPGSAAPPATAPQAAAPDPARISDLAAQIAPQLRDAVADTLNVAAETVAEGAAYFAPMIAKQALLESSGDPTTAQRAKANRRHLWGQVLMTAAANGIPLQQRHELRMLGVLTTVLTTALALATRGAVGVATGGIA